MTSSSDSLSSAPDDISDDRDGTAALAAALKAAGFTPSQVPEPSLFEKVSLLGEGAYGSVWLAKRKPDGLHVALKEVPRFKAECSDDTVRRLWAERQALHAISTARRKSETAREVSPALTGYVASFGNSEFLCLAMDLVEGATLHEHLRRSNGRRLSVHRSRWYAAEVGIALSWLHSNGWLYRDLKMTNVMISALNGRVRLVDFGFAKKAGTAYSVVGTLCTMAPEVIRCAPIEGGTKPGDEGSNCYGQPAEWWSLGILLYEMVTGQAPFGLHDEVLLEGTTVLEKQRQACDEGFTWADDVPALARSAVEGFLQIDVNCRLGAKTGIDEVKSHEFFNCLDWTALASDEAECPDFDRCLGITVERAATQPGRGRRGKFPMHRLPPREPGEKDPFEEF